MKRILLSTVTLLLAGTVFAQPYRPIELAFPSPAEIDNSLLPAADAARGAGYRINEHEKSAYYVMARTYIIKDAVKAELKFITALGDAFHAKNAANLETHLQSARDHLDTALTMLKKEYVKEHEERARLIDKFYIPFTTRYWKNEFYKGIQHTFARIAILGSEIYRIETLMKTLPALEAKARAQLAMEIAAKQEKRQMNRSAVQPSGSVVVVPTTARPMR
jgi:hypothetical protein